MLDQIKITNLTIDAIIGVHQWEQQIKQNLIIDLTIHTNCNNCNDDINNTINYDEITRTSIEFVQSKPFKLIESVANDLANLLKIKFNIQEIIVSVSKPNAIPQAKNVSVTVHR